MVMLSDYVTWRNIHARHCFYLSFKFECNQTSRQLNQLSKVYYDKLYKELSLTREHGQYEKVWTHTDELGQGNRPSSDVCDRLCPWWSGDCHTCTGTQLTKTMIDTDHTQIRGHVQIHHSSAHATMCGYTHIICYAQTQTNIEPIWGQKPALC